MAGKKRKPRVDKKQQQIDDLRKRIEELERERDTRPLAPVPYTPPKKFPKRPADDSPYTPRPAPWIAPDESPYGPRRRPQVWL